MLSLPASATAVAVNAHRFPDNGSVYLGLAAPPLLLTTLVGRQAWRGLSRGRALAATLLALAAMCGVLLAGAFTIFTSSASLGLASGVGGAMALVVYSLLLPALVAVDDPRVAWTIASGFAIAAVPIAWWVQLLANLA
jgi:drug/metabolite transporter (DMT)-like permease